MNSLLLVTSSLFGDASQSRQMAHEYVDSWLHNNPGARVIQRDLTPDTMPHLTQATLGSVMTPADKRTPEQVQLAAFADSLIEEVEAADTIVLAAPMYNFAIPTTLKAWIDHIARAGRTFRYTANGPEGLLSGKKVYVFAARGGMYAGTPRDSQTTYVRDFLGFIGISDVEFVYAEGLNLGEPSKQTALAGARERLEQLAA